MPLLVTSELVKVKVIARHVFRFEYDAGLLANQINVNQMAFVKKSESECRLMQKQTSLLLLFYIFGRKFLS